MELMAVLVEVTSVIASRHKLSKPIQIPRPKHLQRNATQPRDTTGQAPPDQYKRAMATLAASSRPRGVRKGRR